jgi:uncharacterized protein (UPF0335 family)
MKGNDMTQGIAAEQLQSIIRRIENLEESKAEIVADIRDVYTEAKLNGFDPKIIRQIVRLRKLDKAEREEQEALLDLYTHALGMTADADL